MNNRDIPLVTIGICTYNRADGYLPDTLRSAVAQTYPNLEIVISDNCSEDNTEEIVESFGDPRIRYFKQEQNIGVLDNFNFCVAQARGTYFLLLHDDDLIDPDFIEACLVSADYRNDYGFIRTGVRWIDENGETIKERPNRAVGLSTEDFFRAWFKGEGIQMYLCNTLFNTRWLREVGGFYSERILWCDLVPEVQLAAKHGRLDIEDVKASFRVHGTKNSWAGRIEDWCVDSRYLFDIMLPLVDDPDGSFRRLGMQFFANHCLRYARSVEPLSQRLASYHLIYRSFENTNSVFLRAFIKEPIVGFPKRMLKRIRRGAKRIVSRGNDRLATDTSH